MKTNNTILAVLTAILAAFTLASCSSRLDIPRKGVLDKETYYEDVNNLEGAAASMYTEVRGWEYNVLLCKNMLTDDFYAGGAARGDNIDLEKLNEFTFDSEESYIEAMFTTYYSLIYKANVILGNVDPTSGDVAARVVAEAHTFRAWAYFELISMWGNPPLVDHVLSPSEYSMPNGETEALWALVEDDLNAAINSGDLSEKSSVDDNTQWRVTKQYAQALLGKAYLWQGKYEEASKAFNAVVESRLYKLFTAEPYGDMFLSRNDMNCESIFESQRVNDPDNYDFGLYNLMIGWRSSGGEMTIPSNVCFTGGWGFVLPRQALYDAFQKDGDTYRRSESIKTFDEIKAMGVTVNKNMVSAGYWMWKNRIITEEAINSGWSNIRNTRWMRYAEVLLCGAEANFLAGHQDVALNYVNQIRDRAKLSPKGSVTLEDIKLEKRLEMCGEALRYQDLIRWGEGDLMKDNGATYPDCDQNGKVTLISTNQTTYGFKTGKHDRLPYPYTEIMLNDQITQNANY